MLFGIDFIAVARPNGPRDVTLAGHSMGCSVIRTYWDHFGGDRLSKMILIDQAPTVVAGLGWTDRKNAEDRNAVRSQEPLRHGGLPRGSGRGQDDGELLQQRLLHQAYPKGPARVGAAGEPQVPPYAARLLVDHCAQDWRDTIPRITVPTLVFSGKGSFFTPLSQQWIAGRIPGARVEIFEESEGGSHFMFMENPAKFNRIVAEFIG